MNISIAENPYSVCVVIPAYNAEQHIARALESVFNQTIAPDEIIVVDDGSTDNTASVVKSYSPRVRYMYKDNAGASSARNTGIKATSCNWIAFLDADDEWLAEKLQCQIELLQRNQELVWVGCNYLIKTGDEAKNYIAPEICEKMLGGKEYFEHFVRAAGAGIKWNPFCMVIKRKIIERMGFFCTDLHFVEDIDMFLNIAYQWPQLGYVREPLGIYHCGLEGSFTRELSIREKLKWEFALFDRHLKLSREQNQPQIMKDFVAVCLKKRMLNIYILNHRDIVRDILSKYRNTLSWKYRFGMSLLTKPFMPNNAFTRKIARRLLAQKSRENNQCP